MHASVHFVVFFCLVVKNLRAAQWLGLHHDAGLAWPWLKVLGPRQCAYVRMPTHVSQTQYYRYAKQFLVSQTPLWRVLVDATPGLPRLVHLVLPIFHNLLWDPDPRHRAPGLILC